MEFSDAIDLTTTNWTDSLSVSQFDGTLGTLMSVAIRLDGYVAGNASVESMDAAPATVTANLRAEISATSSAMADTLIALPVVSELWDFTAYDGALDFGGPSGATTDTLAGDKTSYLIITGAAMDAFIGTGTIDFALSAEGASDAAGAGNTGTLFNTAAGARLAVQYEYDEAAGTSVVPLPASGLLLAGGLALLGLRRRNKA